MEAYELAVELLAEKGEPIWDCGGGFTVGDDLRPRFHGWVVIGEKGPGERREGEFEYREDKWVRV